MTEPVGALVALKLTHTPFSVSSVLGLLALLGVSVETAVILVSYINKLRQEGMDIRSATREASLLRLRPIMMTALVACLGLLPAALSTGIGSDTQRPFAIVIVAGLISRLFIGFFVNPVLYELVAREGDLLQVSEPTPAHLGTAVPAVQRSKAPHSPLLSQQILTPNRGYPCYFCAISMAPVVH